MPNIAQYLNAIRDAVFGEEVRGAIYNALSAINMESESAMSVASTSQTSAAANASLAQEAATNAGTARTAAETAQGRAETAQTAAETAQTAAGTARTVAEMARTAAETAQGLAETAQEAAETAQGLAETAQEAAETAQTAAETAAGEAADSAQDAEHSAQTAQQYSGNPPRPDSNTKTWWIWDAENEEYVDTHIGSEIAGPQGVSIDDIVLVSGDHTPGSSDIYEVQLSDGGSKRISVWNGRNGTGSGDVLGIGFDLVLPSSGWVNGELTVSDQRLVALSIYKYIIRADDASRDEFLECSVQPKDIVTDGAITFTSEYTPTINLTVSVVRLELAGNNVEEDEEDAT